jgi:hypothetical protein
MILDFPSQKWRVGQEGLGCSEEVECKLSMCEAQGSVLSTRKRMGNKLEKASPLSVVQATVTLYCHGLTRIRWHSVEYME